MSLQHNHHSHSPITLNTAFVLAIVINLVYTGFEGAVALWANSSSLLADAGHNLGDILGLVLAFSANMMLKKKESLRYSYGFKRTTILAALINAGILVLVSLLIAGDAIHALYRLSEINTFDVMVVAAVGILINVLSAMLFFRDKDKDLNVKGAFLHLAMDALISLGVVFVAIVIHITHWFWIDPLVGLMIMILILLGSWRYLLDSINLILDAVPRSINPVKVITYLESCDAVLDAHHLHIWALSTQENAMTVHLTVTATYTNQTCRDIHAQLKDKFDIHHATIQTEDVEEEDKACKIF